MSDRRLADTPITFFLDYITESDIEANYSIIVDGLHKNEVLCEVNRDDNPLNEDGSLKDGYIKDEFDIELQLGNNFETIQRKKVVQYYKIVKKVPDNSGFTTYRAIFSFGDSPCSYPEKRFEEIYFLTDTPFEKDAFFYKRNQGSGGVSYTALTLYGPRVRDENTDPRSPGRRLQTWVNFPDIDPDNFYKVLYIENPFREISNKPREIGAGTSLNIVSYADTQTTISCNNSIIDNRVYPITVFISNIGLDTNRNRKLMCGGLDDNEEKELSKFVKELTVYVRQDPQSDNFTLSDKVLYSSDGKSPIPMSEFMINTPQGTVMANSIKAYGIEELYYTISEFQLFDGNSTNIYMKSSQLAVDTCGDFNQNEKLPKPSLSGCRLVNSRSNPYNFKTTVCDGYEYVWDESQSFWNLNRMVNFRDDLTY